MPMVAVGLLYRYGYFTQKLSASGEQEVSYEAQNFAKLPISPVRDAQGNWQSIQIAFPGRVVTARIWRCDVGRTELYLLDTDHDLNQSEDRSITYHLYGGDWENRLKQEMLLGIGGIRALNAMGIRQDVYHCNEGHAAFTGIERIRNLIHNDKLSFSEALEVVRSSSLFTTHTPVPAGHDAFPESMIRQYMSHYPDRLEITWDQFINLGKTESERPEREVFDELSGMQPVAGGQRRQLAARRGEQGNTRRHVARLFQGRAPYRLRDQRRAFPDLVCGESQAHCTLNTSAKDSAIRTTGSRHGRRCTTSPIANCGTPGSMLKNKLIDAYPQARERSRKQFRFDSPRQMIRIQESLRPDVLTIGFARRFATYKRANLLFTNLDRLDSIVNDPERPVQFIFAGKAHPNDKPGQDLIKRIVEVAAMPQFTGKIIFLQNYDMELARRMVQGVDVWLNTPTRPLEASGTSGEKAVMNGVLQFSVLDGWWVEGYKKGGGWMLPMERTFENQDFQNEMDAELIYNTIEEEIAPLYYRRGREQRSARLGRIDQESAWPISRPTSRRTGCSTTTRNASTASCTNVTNGWSPRISGWRARSRHGKRRVSSAWDKVHVVNTEQFNMDKRSHPDRPRVRRRGRRRHRRAAARGYRRRDDPRRPDHRQQERARHRQTGADFRPSGRVARLLLGPLDPRVDRIVRHGDPRVSEKRQAAAPDGLRTCKMGLTSGIIR